MNDVYKSSTIKLHSGCGGLYITIAKQEKTNAYEKILLELGKNGTCARTFLSQLSEAITLIMTLPKPIRVKFLTKMAGHQCQYRDKTCGELVIRELIHIETKGGDSSNE